MNHSTKKLMRLIGKSKYFKLQSKIPPKYKTKIFVKHSAWLMYKSDEEIITFYSDLVNEPNGFSLLTRIGFIIIITTHINNLLVQLVGAREKKSISKAVSNFDFHDLILYCTAKYAIPDSYFIDLMKLKHFRNTLAHEFDDAMETSFSETLDLFGSSQTIVLYLINKIKNNS